FVVLDADTREGGRTKTDPRYGFLDLGGGYLTDPSTGTQRYLHAMVERFNVPIVDVEVREEGFRVFEPPGKEPVPYPDPNRPSEIPELPPVDDIGAYVMKIEEEVAKMIPFIGHPWDMPGA